MSDLPTWALAREPRRWQGEALAAWKRAGQRGIVGVVTGAGKTLFAELCIVAFRRDLPDGRVFVLVPTLALLDQWFVSLREDLHVPETDIGTYSGEGRSQGWRRINLVVLNTGRTLSSSIPSAGSFLIVDECHRAATQENIRALEGRYAATLGISATPERDYDEGLDELLVPRLGPVVYTYDYSAALEDRVISTFDLVNVEVEMLPKERDAWERLSRRVAFALKRHRAGHDNEAILKRLLQQRAAISATAALRVPVAVKLVEENRGARALVFHERVGAADSIKRMLEARGLSATIYHSGIEAAVRRDNLRLFRQGAFEVLVTCRALDEGMNVPETQVAVIASSTASTRQRIQRLGRVLRPAPGKTGATVYTIYASDPESQRLARDASAANAARSVTWRRVSFQADG